MELNREAASYRARWPAGTSRSGFFMRDSYCSARARSAFRSSPFKPPPTSPRFASGIFTSTGGGSSATRSAARSKSRRWVAYCRFFQFMSGCDATLKPRTTGLANFSDVSLRMRTTKSRICMNSSRKGSDRL